MRCDPLSSFYAYPDCTAMTGRKQGTSCYAALEIEPVRSRCDDQVHPMTADPAPTSPRIVWRPSPSTSIIEARVVDLTPGSVLNGVYVGYVARDVGDIWRGYLGIDFVPVGVGEREALQEMIEERAWDLMRAGALTRRGEGDATEER